MGQEKWKVEFYVKGNGRCPVEEFLHNLHAQDRVFVNNGIKRLREHGLDLSFPYVEFLRDEIWELRVRTNHGRYRVLYFIFDRSKFILLHGILKKSGPVPDLAIDKAIEYKNDYVARNSRGEKP
jgi:phage-related protein